MAYDVFMILETFVFCKLFKLKIIESNYNISLLKVYCPSYD